MQILLGTDLYETIQKTCTTPKYLYADYFDSRAFVI